MYTFKLAMDTKAESQFEHNLFLNVSFGPCILFDYYYLQPITTYKMIGFKYFYEILRIHTLLFKSLGFVMYIKK